MDMKFIAALGIIAVIAFVGIGYASWRGMTGWGAQQIGSWNNSSIMRWGMGHMGAWNNSTVAFNATQLAQFQQAIESGDYAAAQQLHDEYGFGGQLFAKLNQTTFAQYSQIAVLQSQLKNLTATLGQELGFKGQGMVFAAGRMHGMGGMMQPSSDGNKMGRGFGRGMHNFGSSTNNTTTAT